MFSSTSHKILCVLIVLSTAVLAHAQSVPAKEATAVISGTVTIKGKPAPGIVIVLRSFVQNSTGPVLNYKGTTDLNGDYRITNVPAGNYNIVPLAPAFVDANTSGPVRTLLVNKGETVEHIDFALVRGGVITGKVVDAEGHPAIEQEVRLYAVPSTSGNFAMNGVSTDDRGIYRFYGLKAGSYKVSAGDSERGSFGTRTTIYTRSFYPSVPEAEQATVVEVSEGGETTNIDITLGPNLPIYTASGRIVDGATGQPLAGVAYGIKRFVSQYSTSTMSNGAVSNSRGEFRLENLVPGKYAVQISSGPTSKWRADEVPFEIVDENVSGLEVQTRKGATLSGVVVIEGAADKNARNDLRRVSLMATSGRDDKATSAWSMIAPEGTFTISGVAPGTATLQLANTTSFRIVRVERNGVVQGRTIDIKEGEDISLRVIVAYGNCIIRGSVEVTNGPVPAGTRFYVSVRSISDDPMISSSTTPSVEVDARGQFVVEGLFPGTYELSAVVWSPNGNAAVFGDKKQQVVVTAGSVSNVNLSIEINAKTTRP